MMTVPVWTRHTQGTDPNGAILHFMEGDLTLHGLDVKIRLEAKNDGTYQLYVTQIVDDPDAKPWKEYPLPEAMAGEVNTELWLGNDDLYSGKLRSNLASEDHKDFSILTHQLIADVDTVTANAVASGVPLTE